MIILRRKKSLILQNIGKQLVLYFNLTISTRPAILFSLGKASRKIRNPNLMEIGITY